MAGSPRLEVWRTSKRVRYAREGDVLTARADGILLAMAMIPANQAILARTEDVYGALFRAKGSLHWQRLHNYIPAILGAEDGNERYRLFNAGRQAAFAAALHPVEAAPAACGLGAPATSPLLVYGLATAEPGRPIENPDQVSAYRYPPRYGSAPPIFARATHGGGAAARLFFLSGTAAILGHESLHPGDVAAQLETTIANIRKLIEAAAAQGDRVRAEKLRLRVYLKHEADLPEIQAGLARLLPEIEPPPILAADICRPELLVEIEGHAALTR
ncbi:chorismate transformation enzyme, FkbO/Hyg5 family [Arboricoccus pini]|uniref:chorismate transformation enzyme, FkbO/Hyg5 family n=1 Tax=Arboricoccus pini TaxID=1963835 RepID=UPI00105640C2|nr:pteridine-dependent deoxygenase like protein [Arboricoccus pini]